MNEPMEKVIEDLKTSMNATATHLAFLENIGHHAFRQSIKKTDVELREAIDKQNLNLILMSREHLLAWKWINESGRLPLFNEYRMKVQEVLKSEQAKQDQEWADERGYGPSDGADEPTQGEPGTVQGDPE